MNKELFYEIILFAEDKGFKYHLGMLPVMPICVTSYTALAKKIFWEKRWEIIVNHNFCKAIWGEKEIDIELFEVNQNTRGIQAFNGEMFDDWDEMGGLHWFGESRKFHLQRMVLEKDPFKYLEQEYKRIK